MNGFLRYLIKMCYVTIDLETTGNAYAYILLLIWSAGFSSVECFDFHTENTSTNTQDAFEIKCN